MEKTRTGITRTGIRNPVTDKTSTGIRVEPDELKPKRFALKFETSSFKKWAPLTIALVISTYCAFGVMEKDDLLVESRAEIENLKLQIQKKESQIEVLALEKNKLSFEKDEWKKEKLSLTEKVTSLELEVTNLKETEETLWTQFADAEKKSDVLTAEAVAVKMKGRFPASTKISYLEAKVTEMKVKMPAQTVQPATPIAK